MKHILRIIALVALFALVGIVPRAGASIYNGSDYEIVWYTGISWTEANSEVALAGGHLAAITSPEEQAFVAGLLEQEFKLNNHPREFWLGGLQPGGSLGGDPAAGWTWVTGETWNYTNWYNQDWQEPNDNQGVSEDYLGIVWGLGWVEPDGGYTGFYGGAWNDEGGTTNISGYILETPVPTPIPPTALLFFTGLAGLFGVRKRVCFRS